ncbi:hypothetical protein L195_g014458 [Trifolium pratense]|uniref:Uncharacterized protein n=1 Tax=Trifolium pratense TaxID=57577 RepID=A0A2K3PQZ2_TRIPR|nr:hypothetical protein L195_g014458 [Trifolium pratense]
MQEAEKLHYAGGVDLITRRVVYLYEKGSLASLNYAWRVRCHAARNTWPKEVFLSDLVTRGVKRVTRGVTTKKLNYAGCVVGTRAAQS